MVTCQTLAAAVVAVAVVVVAVWKVSLKGPEAGSSKLTRLGCVLQGRVRMKRCLIGCDH